LIIHFPRGSGGDADEEQPGGELVKKRPEMQERCGERSRAWLGTQSAEDASWEPYAPKWRKELNE
jgi:hypothetical protein